ncbi:replication-associated recombination protein A [Candidatus Nitrospira bockiana]
MPRRPAKPPAPGLFAPHDRSSDPDAPLAERMRPKSFEDFVGQDEILAPNRPLRRAIETDTLSSVILWGPPGSGKTTLATIIANHTKAEFIPFSAVTSGIADLREVIRGAEERRALSGRRTMLFVDEIHRFNKAQQDAFLPHVERGTVILLGATTENPSFEVIAPLLSRSIVVVLRPLGDEAMARIIDRALTSETGLAPYRVHLTEEAKRRLIAFGNGDARLVLTALEFIVRQTPRDAEGRVAVTEAALDAAMLKKALRYDRAGEEHYTLISAYIKSLRDSDPDAALYWLARMLEGGEDPIFIARRMLIFASEDVGNADPQAIMVASAVFQAVERVGLPEAQINLAQGTTYLATAPKDNASYVGLLEAVADAKEYGNLPVPLHLRNAVTSLMRDLGYGKGYRYVHDDPGAKTEQLHLPEPLKGKRYYRPKPT